MTDFNNNTQANEGGNTGANSVQMMGCRIAGSPNYTPAYVKTGGDPNKPIQAQCKFAVYMNVRNRKMKFDITAWGKMADIIARSGATGKEITIFAEMNSYKGRVWLPTPDGQPRQHVTLADGQPLLIDKVGFTIRQMHWGPDSAKTIQEEIMAGKRPQGWNDPTSPGKQQWMQICADRNRQQYQAGMNQFGYARVTMPTNGQVVEGNIANNAQGGGYNQIGQAQMQPQQNMQQNMQNQQVGGYQQPNQQIQPQQQMQPNQPVNINGQHMGYAMPNQQQAQPMQNGGYQPQQQPMGYNPNQQQQSNINM